MIKLSPMAAKLKDLKTQDIGSKEIQFTNVENVPESYFDNMVYAVICEFNSRGICYMDVPEASRKRAAKLDLEMTQAANRGDVNQFRELLRQWKRCFH